MILVNLSFKAKKIDIDLIWFCPHGKRILHKNQLLVLSFYSWQEVLVLLPISLHPIFFNHQFSGSCIFSSFSSPRKSKVKSSPNKKTNKKARERDLYTKNYFHACECLLSIMIDKKHSKSAILSLKKFSGELPELLMQFSASIAGTGIAVIFSVICKVAYSRVPFCASKLSSTGIGLGLVWLSWAVNRLRETVVYISRSSGKLDTKEEEMITKLDGSVKDIYFRAATVMAVAVLRLA